MNQPQIKQTDPTFKRLPPDSSQEPNQLRPMPQIMEQKIKEIVTDTLIELELLPKPEKRKNLPDVQRTS